MYEASIDTTLANKLGVDGFCKLMWIDAPLTPDIDDLQDVELLLRIQLASLWVEQSCQGFEEMILEELPEFRLYLLDFTSLDQIIG